MVLIDYFDSLVCRQSPADQEQFLRQNLEKMARNKNTSIEASALLLRYQSIQGAKHFPEWEFGGAEAAMASLGLLHRLRSAGVWPVDFIGEDGQSSGNKSCAKDLLLQRIGMAGNGPSFVEEDWMSIALLRLEEGVSRLLQDPIA